MLVLNRKQGESVLAGDELRIVVLEVRGTYVRLGFCAPDSMKIVREELAPFRGRGPKIDVESLDVLRPAG